MRDICDLEEDDAEEFDVANTFVNQMNHIIKFVLGAVSDTASYLRPWALSLAHAELSYSIRRFCT